MDFINETFDKAKDLFSVAKQKTEEAVNVGKQKLDIAAVENKMAKLYTKLGKEAFSVLANMENMPQEIAGLIEEIKENKELLASLKSDLGKMQHKRECHKCGCVVGEDAVFCNQCGEKLTFEE